MTLVSFTAQILIFLFRALQSGTRNSVSLTKNLIADGKNKRVTSRLNGGVATHTSVTSLPCLTVDLLGKVTILTWGEPIVREKM